MTNYILGSDKKEIDRLEKQHHIWQKEAQHLWKRAGFKNGHHILDIGCGPGFASLELSNIVGDLGKVTALDMSPSYIDHLKGNIQNKKIRNIQTLQGNLHELTLDKNIFDAAYCRFFMIFMTNLEKTIKNIHTALKPKGIWAINDFAAYSPHFMLSPPRKSVSKVVLNRSAVD
jgi:ubiquinone/menaquinone biosynthesis C-methylase UbiE